MHFVHFNTCFHQFKWVDDQGYLVQKIFLLIILIMSLDILIKDLFLMTWYNIPCFSLAMMIIIYRIQKQIFNVPAESGKLHSYIHPRQSYTTYFLALLAQDSQQRSRRFMQIVQIKKVGLILEISINPVMHFSDWKTTSVN